MKGPSALFLVLAGLVIAGCQLSDTRFAEFAQEAADRQAEQNKEMARLTHEVSEGSNQLVTADAQARTEVIAVHRELQVERGKLNDGYNDLESERKQMAEDRRSASLVLPIAEQLGASIVIVAAIAFCWMLLFGARRSDPCEVELTELFMSELAKTEHLPSPQDGNAPDSSPRPTNRIGQSS